MKNFIWIIFLFTVFTARGQYNYSPRCVEAHKQISSLRFNNARILLEKEKSVNPDNLIPTMLEGYMDFLTIIVGENEADFDSLYELRSEQLSLLADGDRQSHWYRSSIARLYLQWAFARVKFGSYFNAARDIRKAYILLEDNNEQFPDFLPDKVGLGILHALVGTIPDNYRWIASLFSMRGSVEQGRAELMRVLEEADDKKYPYLKDEALFFLSFIDLNLQPDKGRAHELMSYYDNKADSNLMLVFSASRILMQTGQNDQAIQLLISHPGGREYYPFYYLDYLSGLAKLNRLDDDAGQYFIRFTANFKGTTYIKSAYQRLAWCELLNGDVQKYDEYMNKVLVYGDDFTDGDKVAMKDAESGKTPKLCLLKARLLYDGGYYTQADSVLEEIDCGLVDGRDMIEFPYRKGRISHAMNNHNAAIEWYKKTIELGAAQTYYFAANAALQLGTIYESSGDFDLAEKYFKKCTQMPNTEYKSSLNQKAKAGLNRIEDKRKLRQ